MVIFCNFKCLWRFSLFLESLTKRWTILEGSSFNNSSTPALHWLLNWSINFPFLAGNRQSPIDLRPTQVNNNKYKQLCIHQRDIQHQIWFDLMPLPGTIIIIIIMITTILVRRTRPFPCKLPSTTTSQKKPTSSTTDTRPSLPPIIRSQSSLLTIDLIAGKSDIKASKSPMNDEMQ